MHLEVEAIAYHGWGFDGSCWLPWQNLFSQQGWNLKVFDRGYFREAIIQAEPQTFANQNAIKVLLIHSYGLHLCPIEQFEQADLLLSFNSFLQFHSEASLEGRRSRRVVNQMIKSFQENPDWVLENFQKNCYYPRSTHALKSQYHDPESQYHEPKLPCYQQALLLRDLKDLNSTAFDSDRLLSIPKILIFQGLQDQILVPAIGRTFFERVKAGSSSHEYFEFATAGHALPFTDTLACWQIVQQVLVQASTQNATQNATQTDLETGSSATQAGGRRE